MITSQSQFVNPLIRAPPLPDSCANTFGRILYKYVCLYFHGTTSGSFGFSILQTAILPEVIYSEKVSVINSLNKWLDLSHLEKGVYTVSLNLEGKTAQTQKIIIK